MRVRASLCVRVRASLCVRVRVRVLAYLHIYMCVSVGACMFA